MTAKQLAQRLSINVSRLDFKFSNICDQFKKMGGSVHVQCSVCRPTILVEIQEDKNA